MIFSVFSWFNSLYIFFLGNSSEILPFYHHSRTYGTETRLVYFGFCFVKPCVSLTRHAFLLWLRYQEFGITCLHFSVSVLFLAMAVLSCVGQCVLLPFLVRAYLFVSFVRKPQKHVWLGTFFSCTFLFICQCVFVVCAVAFAKKYSVELYHSLCAIFCTDAFILLVLFSYLFHCSFCNFANIE